MGRLAHGSGDGGMSSRTTKSKGDRSLSETAPAIIAWRLDHNTAMAGMRPHPSALDFQRQPRAAVCSSMKGAL